MRPTLFIAACLLCACPREQPGPVVPSTAVTCRIAPAMVDFGEVESSVPGRFDATEIILTNPSAFDRDMLVEPLDAPFSFDSPGPFVLGASSSRRFLVRFAPVDALLHLAEFRVSEQHTDDPRCALTVPLRGLGSGSLTVGSQLLDFGSLEAGETRTLSLSVINSRRTPVSIDSIDLVVANGLSSPFSISAPNLTIPARGLFELQVIAAPSGPGVFSGLLTLNADDEQVGTALELTSGKPVAEVLPELGAPWLVGYDFGSTPASFSNRSIRVRNVGTSGGIAELALRLDTPGMLVEVLEGNLDELAVSAPLSLSRGLLEGDSAAIDLQLTPISPGLKRFRITLFTNAPDSVGHEVLVNALVETLPRCELQVDPPALLRLTPGTDGGSEGTVTFLNTGPERCVVDDLRLAEGTNPLFGIAGATTQVTLAAGESHVVTVFGPRVTTTRFGNLRFHVYNRDSSTQLIALYSTP